jgi:putative membrane protein
MNLTISDLPAINASLNGLATIFLTLGYIFIKRGQRDAHRNCMIAAVITSAIFLIFYVLHKILVRGVHTPFGGEGPIRTVYYVMLISHIVLAMAIVPLVLMTMSRALKQRWELHKQISRWTWPLWMYVSVTGVLVYLMLYQWFPAAK